MVSGKSLGRFWVPALLTAGAILLAATAQPCGAAQPPAQDAAAAPAVDAAQTVKHPLEPALIWAKEGLKSVEKIRDYSAVVIKRERVGGEVGEYQYMFVKVRHEPFSVYMYFLAPDKLKGREVIYVEGKNEGKMWAHGVGAQKIFGTLSLAPDGRIAMDGQRYPLTELGILNLVRRLIEVAEKDCKYGECDVQYFKGAEINKRKCTCIQVVHPVPRRNFMFHMARIFVDDEYNMPIRYEAHDWPEEEGGPPRLIEEYTYANLKLNVGFTDADFDVENPNYGF